MNFAVKTTQIPGCQEALKEGGLTGPQAPKAETADAEIVRWCFETTDRIGGMMRNMFLRSLREQFERGRGLSQRQFSILARAVGENAALLPDCEEVRARLSEFVPGGFGESRVEDPAVPGLFAMLEKVARWRPASTKGRRVYDDQSFVKSLSEQYERRHTLSPRQLAALRRVVASYREQIPNYAEEAPKLGLKESPARRGRKKAKAEVDAPGDES